MIVLVITNSLRQKQGARIEDVRHVEKIPELCARSKRRCDTPPLINQPLVTFRTLSKHAPRNAQYGREQGCGCGGNNSMIERLHTRRGKAKMYPWNSEGILGHHPRDSTTRKMALRLRLTVPDTTSLNCTVDSTLQPISHRLPYTPLPPIPSSFATGLSSKTPQKAFK